MKSLITLSVLLLYLFSYSANAQIWNKIKKAAKRGVERVVENRTEKDVEDATNDIYESIGGSGDDASSNEESRSSKKKRNNTNTSLEDNQSLEEDGDNQVGFTRGGKIIFSDNFSKDAIGDFPAQWKTNKGGEVKTLKGFDEKWLKVTSGSKVSVELNKQLPANYTVEMDIVIPSNNPYVMAGIGFMENPRENLGYLLAPKQGVAIMLLGFKKDFIYQYGTRDIQNSWAATTTGYPLNKKIHLAFEINNHERFRAYADGKKIVDLPKMFKPEYANEVIIQAITNGNKLTQQNEFYISNVVIAETGTDQRSQISKDLLENGTFTTNDILFASGSDVIQDSSFDILNEIGKTLTTAPSMNFLIIGHTDSDGDNTSNQILSQKRAEAVKEYLINNFSIASNQLVCVGKGESEPVGSNDTAKGKKQNRRVEFKKI